MVWSRAAQISAFHGSVAVLCAFSAVSCRSKPAARGGRPAGSASASASVAAAPPAPASSAWACRELTETAPLALGRSLRSNAVEQAEEDEAETIGEGEAELPFSVELGAARASQTTFAVGGIQSERGESHAVLVFVAREGQPAQSLALGRVFGDVEPPSVTPFRDGWISLQANSDAQGVSLRLYGVAPPLTPSALRRGGEITGVRRDASGFSLEVSAKEGLVAYSFLEKGHGGIALSRFDPLALSLSGKPRHLPAPSDGDAESPRLVARSGGYYLAWIVRGAVPARDKLMPKPDAGEDLKLLEEGPTAIEIQPLDTAGAPTGSPKRVTPSGARVLAFELLASADDGALIVYRDEREGPGLERSSAEVVALRADGSMQTKSWELGESSGVPSLLADAQRAPEAPVAWLSAAGASGLRLFALGADGLTLGESKQDARLNGVEPLAMAGGHWFVTRQRAGRREFSVLACQGAAL